MGSERSDNAITSLTIEGYKSIKDKTTIETKPLTVIAGANSSGKSSLIQPLLLLKQTLEGRFDQGPIKLDGPNVLFDSPRNFITHIPGKSISHPFCFGVGMSSGVGFDTLCSYSARKKLSVLSTIYRLGEEEISLNPKAISQREVEFFGKSENIPTNALRNELTKDSIVRDRCFQVLKAFGWLRPVGILRDTTSAITQTIHLPGLRGNVRRLHPMAALGNSYPGVFLDYYASLLADWRENQKSKNNRINKQLRDLGLTWKVEARQQSDVSVSIMVGRLKTPKKSGASDIVDIADVGRGVSQVLPVLVALEAAKKGQLIFIEEPEMHLHPLAQYKLAEVLASAIKAGKRVVIETHSVFLLSAIQTLVATDVIPSNKVILYWCSRDNDGYTKVDASPLDDYGRFQADWPEDFGEIELESDTKYLDAVAVKRRKKRNGNKVSKTPRD